MPELSGLPAGTEFDDADYIPYVDTDDLTESALGTTKRILKTSLVSSATSPGLVELATAAEAQAGTDTARAVTPAGLAEYMKQPLTVGVNGSVEGSVTLAALESADWHMYGAQVEWFSNPNDVFLFGYNRPGFATRDDNALHTMSMVIEADYYATAEDHYTEWYVEYQAADGVTTRRPFQTSINLDTNAIVNAITGVCSYYNSSAELQRQTEESVTHISFYGAAIRGMVNNAYLLSQWNAANSVFYHIWLNSADQWAIDAPITMYADILFNHDSAHGVILMDRVGGAQYRLKVESGVLGIEAV